MHKYDVAVIGGSLAGSYVALLLAERGYEVLLLEKDQLPRRKACGEGMAAVAKSYLEKIGIWNTLPEDSYSPYFGYDISFENQSSREDACSLRRAGVKNTPEGYRVSRQILDDKVYQRTFFTSGISRQEASVRNITKSGESWILECGEKEFHSTYLVMAGGASSLPLLKRSVSVHEDVRGDRARFGMVLWVEGSWRKGTPDTVIAKSCSGYQILLTAINDQLLNISLLIDRQDEGFREQDRKELLEKSLEFADFSGFYVENILEQRGASRIESRKIETGDPLLYLIGDSAEVFDPIGGLGMVHAFVSAELAAESLDLAMTKALSPAKAFKRYQRRRSYFAMKVRVLTAMSYSLIVQKHWLVQFLVRKAPSISAVIFSFLRKSLLKSPRSKKSFDAVPLTECENLVQ